jgi:hypothetical protein
MKSNITTSTAATMIIIAIMIGLFSLLDGLTANPAQEATRAQLALSDTAGGSH